LNFGQQNPAPATHILHHHDMFRIAIIGGGIGGIFAALSIHHHCKQHGVQIDIYEQALEYGEIGAGVGIGPNSAALIEKLGQMEEALKTAGNRDGVWLSFRRYDTASEVLTVMSPKNGNATQLPMHRAEFLDVLTRAIERRGAARMHTNKRCQGLEVDLTH
jgi:salicylate hydroxylase